MLRMIIADDESIVRRGLRNVINWETFGIEVVAEAQDGMEALELCKELAPDILFTDIRMPIMDGLELAMKLEELGSPIRVIFISGVQDFNYAKTALDINADGYVLKPVVVTELNEVIGKVVNRIKLGRKQHTELQQLKRQIHENFPVIRENFLRNLAGGVYVNDVVIHGKLEYFQIPLLPDESFLVSILQMDDYERKTENMSEEDKQILSFSVSNIVEEIVTNAAAGVSFRSNENEFIQIYNQSALLNKKYSEISAEIVLCLEKFLKISVSIGIGRPIGNLSAVNSSLKDARTALQYKFYTGKNSILDIGDIHVMTETGSGNSNSSGFYAEEGELMNSIKLGDVDGASTAISRLFDSLGQDRSTPVDYIQGMCVELIYIASRTVQDLGENLNGMGEKRSILIETIYKKESVTDLRQYMLNLFADMARYFLKKYNQKNAKVIGRIKEIVDQSYNGDISAAKISREVYLTPNYISMIFKQATGETITEYITKVRMEKAKHLLKSTDLKILEIAEKVGYEDPHYFSKVFKKYTGIHPQKHRM
ncbi:response regulator [Paenibacillus sinopodophylli]|uniref:response regulator n=1 Tax=Paenibacillus sinopodophylli TaxID=1837342 RepID=UPI00110CE338|nr:response regulator [Paenibacillus sinopodophylli]